MTRFSARSLAVSAAAVGGSSILALTLTTAGATGQGPATEAATGTPLTLSVELFNFTNTTISLSFFDADNATSAPFCQTTCTFGPNPSFTPVLTTTVSFASASQDNLLEYQEMDSDGSRAECEIQPQGTDGYYNAYTDWGSISVGAEGSTDWIQVYIGAPPAR